MQTQLRSIAEGTQPSGTVALTRGQLAAVIAIGVAFWFSAALTVQFGAPAGFFGPTASALLFAVSIPICWLSVLLTKKLARLRAGQTLPGIAIGLVAATICDAVALTWGRGLYGSDPAQIVSGAAWILWGVGFFLLFAFLDDYR
jgi:hypothetical protein